MLYNFEIIFGAHFSGGGQFCLGIDENLLKICLLVSYLQYCMNKQQPENKLLLSGGEGHLDTNLEFFVLRN